MRKKYNVGGQAVIEGVMMRGSKAIATAVRTPNGTIEIDIKNGEAISKRYKLLSVPIIRGFVSLIESLVLGIKTLNYSASFFEEEEEEESKFELWLKNKLGNRANDFIIGVSLIISLLFSIGLFFVLPTFIANFFKKSGISIVALNIIEGLIRVSIFLLYMYLVGKIEDIGRLYQYHGAEHKTIFCYENEKELTIENVKDFGRLHPRCGTNFMFLVMIISILLFSITGWNSIGQRILYRILLLPLVSGITYEIIKWLGKSENFLSRLVAYPGLKLQMLTTREPDESQIEVAIAALRASEGLEESCKTVRELLDYGNKVLRGVGIDSCILDCQLLLGKVLDKDKLFLITHSDEKISKVKEEEFYKLIDLRKARMPIKYILGHSEFMGLDFFVKQGVLIPRPDTEILVERGIDIVKENNLSKVCDLCCGTGAIGIALVNYCPNAEVHCYDISQEAKFVTETNIHKFELNNRVKFYLSDLLTVAIEEGKKYDIILSNPPYIREDIIPTLMEEVKNYEPYIALSGGADGLGFYKKIVEQSKFVLNSNGVLAFEIGHDQGEDVKNIMRSKGFERLEIVKDLAGNDRVVVGVLKEP